MNLREGAELVGMTVLPSQVFAAEAGDGEAPEEASASDSDEEASAAAEQGDAVEPWLLLVTSKGIGKRVRASEIRLQQRGGGVGGRVIKLGPGDRLAAAQVVTPPEDTADAGSVELDVLISTVHGISMRTPLSRIRVLKRQSRGHQLVKLDEGDAVADITIVSTNPAA